MKRSGSACLGPWTEGVAGLVGPAVRRCRGTAVVEIPQARLEEGLETGPVLALERAQSLDLLLQALLLVRDGADQLVVLALSVTFQVAGLVPCLAFQRLGTGPRLVEHGLGTRAGLVDHR